VSDPTPHLDLEEVDLALAAVKARFDQADAPHEPDVLTLIRAAEKLRAALDPAGVGHLDLLVDFSAWLERGGYLAERPGVDRQLTGLALSYLAAGRGDQPRRVPPNWSRLINALILLARGAANSYPTYCTHDRMIVCADPDRFTAEEVTALEKLGFSPTSEGGFESTEFGSC
jgi:hypothetical protein